jgi:hypothetical protein
VSATTANLGDVDSIVTDLDDIPPGVAIRTVYGWAVRGSARGGWTVYVCHEPYTYPAESGALPAVGRFEREVPTDAVADMLRTPLNAAPAVVDLGYIIRLGDPWGNLDLGGSAATTRAILAGAVGGHITATITSVDHSEVDTYDGKILAVASDYDSAGHWSVIIGEVKGVPAWRSPFAVPIRRITVGNLW